MYPTTIASRATLALLLLLTGACGPLPPWEVGDAFAKGQDIAGYLADRQIEEFAEGSAILGEGGPIAKAGELRASIAVSRATRSVPSLAGVIVAEGPPQSSILPVAEAAATRVQLDVGIGVLAGFKAGTTRFLSVDLLGRLALSSVFPTRIPEASQKGNMTVGFGTRIGVIAETAKLPGIAVTYLRSYLPRLSWQAAGIRTDSGNTAAISTTDDFSHYNSQRITLNKRFGPVSATAGWGDDNIERSYRLSARTTGANPKSRQETQSHDAARRSILFVGSGFRLTRHLSAAAEIIRSAPKGTIYSTNTMGDSPRHAITRLRLGVTLGK